MTTAASDRKLRIGPRATDSAAAAPVCGPRGAYIVFIIACLVMLASGDRQILSILLVPIQKDLRVSDTGMGALTGIAFTAVYATIALPLARLTDVGVRRHIVTAAIAVWSVMTLSCGLASSYVTLLLARMGVASGEAVLHPAWTSMVGDFFSPKRRGTALAFIMLGGALGTSFCAFVAARLTDVYNWHVAFLALGVPGLLLAVVFYLTVPEPVRGASDGGQQRDSSAQSWRGSIAHLASIASVGPLLLGSIFTFLSFTSFTGWVPAYLMRVEGMSASSMGFWWMATTAPAVLGIPIGGTLSDLLARRGARWRLYYIAGSLAVGAPLFCAVLIAHDLRIILSMLFIYAIVVGPVVAIIPATYLDVTPPRLRGTMVAAGSFCANVVGAGLGPVVIGAVNDQVKLYHGLHSLRYSLIVLPVFMLAAALMLLWASRTADRDAEAARTGNTAPGRQKPRGSPQNQRVGRRKPHVIRVGAAGSQRRPHHE
ncbi:MAG: MFS transporter [Caulobacteraceae bacterium]|nr:MFS transporter [Caulobacteraceae bacterium]